MFSPVVTDAMFTTNVWWRKRLHPGIRDVTSPPKKSFYVLFIYPKKKLISRCVDIVSKCGFCKKKERHRFILWMLVYKSGFWKNKQDYFEPTIQWRWKPKVQLILYYENRKKQEVQRTVKLLISLVKLHIHKFSRSHPSFELDDWI